MSQDRDWRPQARDDAKSAVPYPAQEAYEQSVSSVQYDPQPQNIGSYAHPVPVSTTGCPAVPPPAPYTARMYPQGAVLYGSSYAPYSTFPDGRESTIAAAATGGIDGSVGAPVPVTSQAPLSAYTYPATPAALPYGVSTNPNMPSEAPSASPYTSTTSVYAMAPPPVPRPLTASSSRSATGAVRHRGRAGRVLARAREHIDNIHERSGPPEVHWSEADAEGTWVLMFVPAQRGYE